MRGAKLHITAQLFAEICKATKAGPPRYFEVVERPLPADAQVAHVEGDGSMLHLIVTSDSYDDVDESALPTLIPPVYRTVFFE